MTDRWWWWWWWWCENTNSWSNILSTHQTWNPTLIRIIPDTAARCYEINF
jgi:hypothetical protein